MSLKENIKSAARILTIPKDWKAKGNMEFDELLSIALSHPEIAEKEICERFDYWYKEYRLTQIAMRAIITISFAAIAFGCIHVCNVMAFCLYVLIIIPIIICALLIRRRAQAIHNKLLDCYSWLINEILHPAKEGYTISPTIEKAFIKASAQAERREYIEQKKFNRIINGFGYSSITVNN